MKCFKGFLGTLLLAGLVLPFLVQTTASAQSTGSINGTVTDKSGAVIAGATVVVTDKQTGVSRSVTTDRAGAYAVPSLQPGTYSVKASESGMQVVTIDGVVLSVSSTIPVNVQLGVEASNQTVQVNAAAANIETSTMTVGQVIDQKTVQDVPLNGRHFVDLGVLLAGSVTAPQSGFLTSPLRGQGASSFDSAGGREDTVNFMINGVNLNDMSQNQITFQPTINTVSEFKADNSSFSAEMGRNSGTIVQIATRSGTNAFHGEGYDFIRNSAVDARNYFNRAPVVQSPFKRNQFGGDVGGPIWKNHTFFFLSYEGLRQRQGLTINSTVPTNAQRAAVTDPIIKKLLTLIPTANDSTGTQYVGSATAPVNIDQFTGDFAHTFSTADTLHFFYAWQQDKRIEPTLQGDSVPNFGDHRTAHRQIGTLVETHVFSPSLVNEARLGFNRIAISFSPQFAADQTAYGINAGVTQPIGLPQIQVQAAGLTFGGPSGFPQGRFDTTGVFSDTLNYLRGKHSIKVGGEFRRFINDNYASDTGFFRFNTMTTFLNDQASFFNVTPGNRPSRIFINAAGMFVQDNYKVTDRLSLELGARFDWNGTPREAVNRFVVFDAGTASLVQQGSNGLSSVYNQNYNFEPRLGFAYDVSGHGTTILRGGYGLQSDQPVANLVSNLASNPPFAIPVSTTAATSLGNAFTLAKASASLSPASVQRNFRNAYVQTFNLNVQQQFPKEITIQVGYYGSKGTHLRLQRNLNQPVNGVKPYAKLSAASSIKPGAGLGTIADGESVSYSNYNGLWVTATKNFSQGLEFNTTYQWTKSMDANSLSSQGFTLQDNNNIAGNYGPSDFDARNRLVLSGVYSLPFQENIFVKGWRLSSILQLQSGNPFTILTTSGLNGTGVGIRPDVLVPVGSIKTSRTVAANGNVQFIAPSVCSTQTTGCEFASDGKHFGDSTRGMLYGPGFENLDLSIAKVTPIRGSVSFELRFDAFNSLNHANLGQPNSTFAIGATPLSAGTFGQIGSTRTPVGDSGSSRQLQLAGKIIF
jgi:hypothetical protein